VVGEDLAQLGVGEREAFGDGVGVREQSVACGREA